MIGFVERHSRLIAGVLFALVILAAVPVMPHMLTYAFGIHRESDETALTWEKDLHTSDGRIVHCLATEHGMSCDWGHATVAK